MAGTGHAYEIANLDEFNQFLANNTRIDTSDSSYLLEWLQSKKTRKYLTSERFTRAVSSVEEIENFANPLEVKYLLEKYEGGIEVRCFSSSLIEVHGIDIRHALDWMQWLEHADTRMFSKLQRLSVDQVLVKSKEWLKYGALESASRGATAVEMMTTNGRSWLRLMDGDALSSEGFAMKHCVWAPQYEDELRMDKSRFYSLREGQRPIVTIQLDTISNSVVQAHGYANSPVPFSCHQCLADLLNHLRVSPTQSLPGSLGVDFTDDGEWKKIIDVWKPVDWEGFKAFSKGDVMILMSSRYPGLSLGRVHLFNRRGTNNAIKGTFIIDQGRHFHIEEQREIAKLLTYLGGDHYLKDVKLIRNSEGVLIPFYDSLERQNVNGVTCLFETIDGFLTHQKSKRVYIPHSRDDARILVTIDKYGSYTEQKTIFNFIERWNKTEAYRVFNALTELNVQFLTNNEELKNIQNKFYPVYVQGSGWELFGIEALKIEGFTDNSFHWKETDYLATLDSGHGRIKIHLNSSEVTSIDTFWVSHNAFREAAAFLNQRGFSPSSDYKVRGDQLCKGGQDKFRFNGLFHFRGEWHAPSSYEEMINILKSKSKGARLYKLNPNESETVITTLSAENYDADPVLAEALKWWIKKGSRKSNLLVLTSNRPFFFNSDTSSYSSIESRFDASIRLADHFDETYLRHFKRIAELIMKTRLRDKSILNSHEVLNYVEKYHPWISDKLLQRSLKAALRYGRLNSRSVDRDIPSREIIRLYPRAVDIGLGHLVIDAANWTAFGFPKNLTTLTFEDAEVWMECFELAFRSYWASRSQEGLQLFEGLVRVNAKEGATEGDWVALIGRIEALQHVSCAKEAA